MLTEFWPIESNAGMLLFVVSAIFSALQSHMNRGIGSDHPVHAFLRDGIRANGLRIPRTVQGLLNKTHFGALPQYMHWCLAVLPDAAVKLFDWALNPIVNSLHIVVLWIAARTLGEIAGANTDNLWLGILIVALTPQFYHATSARNFGLSARGIGLCLLTVFQSGIVLIQYHEYKLGGWIIAVTAAWLILGFNTFALQVLVLASAIQAILGVLQPLAAAIVGTLIFLLLHPTYSITYLKATYGFIRTYCVSVAQATILKRRFSHWTDIFGGGILHKYYSEGALRAIMYAYENSILIVLILNPATVIAALIALDRRMAGNTMQNTLATYVIAGFVLMFATSFRRLRFLGEPERYIEAITPWAIPYLILFTDLGQNKKLQVKYLYCSTILVLLQIGLTWRISAKNRSRNDAIGELEDFLTAEQEKFPLEKIRLCFDNEQISKLLLRHGWEYVCMMVPGQEYGTYEFDEAFSNYPIVNPKVVAENAQRYKVTHIIVEATNNVITPNYLRQEFAIDSSVAFKNDRYKAIKLMSQHA